MKRCPTCNRTFENGLTYCLIDGSVLSAPFTEEAQEHSEATQVLPSNESLTAKPDRVARDTSPAPTMTAVYQPPVARRVDLPETVAAASEKKPYLWLATVAVTTLFFLVATAVLMVLDYHLEMGSYIVFVLARRSPLFLLALI